jgi:hypothetical protein
MSFKVIIENVNEKLEMLIESDSFYKSERLY